MATPVLNSVSQDTLVNAIGTLGVQSASNLTSGRDTPLPTANFSDETLQLLNRAAAALNLTDNTITQPNKRRKLEPNDDLKRLNYPQASKSIYLKTKTLHRKKLSLATNIHQIKQLLTDQKFPLQADFNSRVPMNRDQNFRNQWVAITNKCKNDLTNLFLTDLSNKYRNTKLEIESNLTQLQGMLSNAQFAEIKEFLHTKYRQAMNTTFNRTAARIEKTRPRPAQRRPQTGPRRQFNNRRPAKQNRTNGDIKSLLSTLLKNM